MLGDQRGKPYAMHGEQVAVGTVLALTVAAKLAAITPDFDAAREAAAKYDAAAWESEIRRAYGDAAGAIIELEAQSGKNQTAGRLKRIDIMQQHWDEVRVMLAGVYPAEKLRTLLKDIGCPCEPRDIGVTKDILRDALLYCKETRARYTVYQLAWDLGLLAKLADEVCAEAECAE